MEAVMEIDNTENKILWSFHRHRIFSSEALPKQSLNGEWYWSISKQCIRDDIWAASHTGVIQGL